MIEIRKLSGSHEMQDSALMTVDKKDGREMTDDLLRRYLISEHSPIRSIMISVVMMDISYYTSVHFSRHVHTLHYVSTSRPDLIGRPRSIDDRVNHKMIMNVQALIDMMRKRLCMRCAEETRRVAESIRLLMLHDADNEIRIIGGVLVPNCVYRGACPEFKPCLRSGKYDLGIPSIVERYLEYDDRFKEEVDHVE